MLVLHWLAALLACLLASRAACLPDCLTALLLSGALLVPPPPHRPEKPRQSQRCERWPLHYTRSRHTEGTLSPCCALCAAWLRCSNIPHRPGASVAPPQSESPTHVACQLGRRAGMGTNPLQANSTKCTAAPLYTYIYLHILIRVIRTNRTTAPRRAAPSEENA